MFLFRKHLRNESDFKAQNLEIPDLFKLSVAKFMYSFYNGGLPIPLDNYFAEIAVYRRFRNTIVH